MPFIALQFFDGDMKETITIMLVCSATLWLLLNIGFFCTIDLSYLNTFFGTMTAPQYACELFLSASSEDIIKFKVAFRKNLRFTKSIEAEAKEWVANNIDQWKVDKPDWFKIELIPDEFLPQAVLEAEGGAAKRRRSSVSLREIVGIAPVVNKNDSSRVFPEE